MRVLAGTLMLAALAVGLTACWLLNTVPLAAFTASALSGRAPVTISFSAILSQDEDGDITNWEWNFGDGASAVGESVSHEYTRAGTFTVVLKVTDDDGGTATASKVVTILEGDGDDDDGDGDDTGGPTARFTTTPLTGQVPFTVTVNASTSTYSGHAITSYSWNFGDGTTGTGVTATHQYGAAGTYNIVLRIIGSDNTTGTASQQVIATDIPVTPPTGGPTASFTVDKTNFVGPDVVTMDPAASSAVAGETIDLYVWQFGMSGASQDEPSDTPVNFTYWTQNTTETYTITLTVIQSNGLTDSFSRTITVKNLQPVAGFAVSEDAGATWEYPTEADFLEVYPPVGGWVAAPTIDIESPDALPSGGRYWNNGLPALTKGAVAPDGINENTGVRPANFVLADKNLSYDAEGQSPNDDGWGIASYYVNFDDGTSGDSYPAVAAGGGFAQFAHAYPIPVANYVDYTIRVTVTDERGGTDTLARKVRIYKDPP